MSTNNSTLVSYNRNAVGIEVRFPKDRRLTQSELNEVKELKLSWHRKNHYYYTRFSEEKLEAIKKSFIGKETTLPKATATKEMVKLAAEKAASAPVKKPRTSKTAEAIEQMQAQINQLTQLLAAQQTTAK